MTRAPWAWAAAAVTTMAVGVGCYSPAPYSPGYAYPAPAGAYPVAPGGSYVVPGGAMPGGVPSGTLGPAMSAPGAGPTLAPPLNGSTGGETNPSTFAPGTGGGVPNYEDPNANDFESGNGFGTTPDDGFQQPQSNGSPFMREGAAAPRRFQMEQASRPMGDVDYFAGIDDIRPTPVPSNLAAGATSVRPAGFEERPKPVDDFGFDPGAAPQSRDAAEGGGDFGYDRGGYAWLQGVVDFDPDRKNWHIIYGLPPDPADRYFGSLTLADDGRLADFQDNDVVLVKGRIDQSAGRDLLGKPLYRVQSAELIGRFE